jgi:hypothetical protein
MSINYLNDISELYNQVAESSHLETDMKKRAEENEKARKEMVKTKSHKDMVDTARKKFDEDVDQDSDGDNDFADVRIARMIASGVPKEVAIQKTRNKSYNKKSKIKEGFSNWRQDLSEVVKDIEDTKKIKEKKINNKIKINPTMREAVEDLGGTLIEMVELNEEVLQETVDISSEYFYLEGLNEDGVDILIEELGIEEFANFVFELADEYTLIEARRSGRIEPVTKSGKSVGSLKGGAKTAAIKRLKKEKEARRESESSSGSSGMKAALQRQSAIANAKKQQPQKAETPTQTKKGIAGKVGAALGSLVKKGREDIKRVQDAAQTARKVGERRAAEVAAVYSAVREKGKKAEQSAAATRARRKATVAAGRAVQAAAPVAKKAVTAAAAAAGAGAGSLKAGKSPAAAAGRAAGTLVRKMKEDYDVDFINQLWDEVSERLEVLGEMEGLKFEVISEKMNLATADMGDVIRDFEKSDAPQFKGKTKKERRQMAIAAKLTAERGGKKLKEQEEVADASQKQMLAKKKQMLQKQQMLDKQRLQMQQQGKLPMGHAMEEVEHVDEANRYAKETGKSFRTGRDVVSGGSAKNDKAFQLVSKMMGSGRVGVQPRGKKKVPGQKPPVAGEYGAPKSPAQKVASRRASAQQSQDMMHSRFD